MTELNTSKTHEWFLSTVTITPRASGQKLKLTWSCVTDEYDIVEWCGLGEKGEPGPRLMELLQRLGLPGEPRKDPTQYIRKGMHIWSKVHRHWPEARDETPSYEFVYETLSAQQSRDTKADAATRARVLKIAQSCQTRAQAETRLKSMNADYLPVLGELIESGELALG